MRTRALAGSLWNLSMIFNWISSSISQCDYYQDVEVDSTYYVYSPGYPERYAGGTNCRWYAVAPPGAFLRINCPVVDLPQSPSCSGDRMSVSRTGNLLMTDADHYCGQGSFDQLSVANKMNVLLQTVRSSPGGRFLCSITSYRTGLVSTTPSPPPQTCNCGWKQKTKIVGGSETGVNEYPMMAGLVDMDLEIVYCGGTIISPRFVVTAGHCLMRRTAARVSVLVGDHDLTTGTETSSSRLIRASTLVPHPQYEAKDQVNDIGLIRMQQDIEFSQKIGPACLPLRFKETSFEGELVTILGWGTTDFGGPTSDVLKQTKLNVVSDQQCRQSYDPGSITDRQMCTHAPDTDACQSDSGGPVLWQDSSTGRLHVVGIISYGIACATSKPGVNTRVAPYLEWILQTTQETYCLK